MTVSPESAGEAVPAPEQPAPDAATRKVTLSAVAEEMAIEADFQKNRKLIRAAQVDEMAASNAALVAKVEELAAALEAIPGGKNGDPA